MKNLNPNRIMWMVIPDQEIMHTVYRTETYNDMFHVKLNFITKSGNGGMIQKAVENTIFSNFGDAKKFFLDFMKKKTEITLWDDYTSVLGYFNEYEDANKKFVRFKNLQKLLDD